MSYHKLRSSHSSSSTLARARIAAGLTQQQLGDLASTPQAVIAQYESGKSRPKFPRAEAIASVLNRTVRDFWPLLADAVEEGRLLDTVIPFAPAAKVIRERRGYRLAHEDPEGGQRRPHVHRPPLCCGQHWCRCVELEDPATYPVFGDPGLIEFVAEGA
jgi:transcriptional regulator with XRE-family HTH domain